MSLLELIGSMAASFIVLALMFGPLERVFAAREQPVLHRHTRLDLAFFAGQYLLWNVPAQVLLAKLGHWLSPDGLRLPGSAWLWAVPVVAAGDLAVYWFHRLCHVVPWLWRFHAVHHSVERLDWLAAHREHPFDGLATQLVVNLPALMVGFPLHVMGPFIVFRGLWAVFIHANVRLPLGPMRWVLGAPQWHRWHHARVAQTRHNFGNLAPWTDWLFGTHADVRDEGYALGVEGGAPSGYLGLLLGRSSRADVQLDHGQREI